MTAAADAPPRRILVIVTRRIGDVLLATPLIRSLKQAWPQAQIEALVFEGTQGVLAGNPDMAAVHTIAERPDLRVLRDPFSAKPNVLFYASKRVGGDITDFAAIKLLKFALT